MCFHGLHAEVETRCDPLGAVAFSQKLKDMGLDGNLLVITDALDENLYLSSRNLPNVLVLEAQEADPVSLVRFAKVLVTKSAVAKFEEMWG